MPWYYCGVLSIYHGITVVFGTCTMVLACFVCFLFFMCTIVLRFYFGHILSIAWYYRGNLGIYHNGVNMVVLCAMVLECYFWLTP